MKLRNLAYLVIASILVISCGGDDPLPDPFDHAGQATKDDESLREYLETHFYTPPVGTAHFGVIDTLENNESSLLSQVITKQIDFSDISYKIYVLKNNDGVGDNPILLDSAYVNYKGQLLNGNVFDENESYFWANLNGAVIPGWSYALPNYKAGVNVSQVGSPISFENMGTGVFFLPSGLAYREAAQLLIPSSSPLTFHIEMAMIKRSDQDRDGVFTKYENLDNDEEYSDDDTDGDGVPDYVDFDDDNDLLSTMYENADPNDDGNPDDALDTDGDNIPNYLDNDDDGDGILTKDENADPDGNGNPSDAKDTDGDMIPDYLDNN